MTEPEEVTRDPTLCLEAGSYKTWEGVFGAFWEHRKVHNGARGRALLRTWKWMYPRRFEEAWARLCPGEEQK